MPVAQSSVIPNKAHYGYEQTDLHMLTVSIFSLLAFKGVSITADKLGPQQGLPGSLNPKAWEIFYFLFSVHE